MALADLQQAANSLVKTQISGDSFESLVARRDTHAVLDLSGDARSLLILFGGIAGGVSMPVFEFFRLTSSMPGKKAFLRDPLRGWYQLGIPGIGSTATDIRDFLNDVIADADVDRVVMAGASAGGFAALLFGTWCGADEVIAFSPQTFIDPENRRKSADDRWAQQIGDLYAAMAGRGPILDILDVLPANDGNVRIQIHVSSDDALDMAHAHRMDGRNDTSIVVHENGGHRLVKTLRDRGLLQPILLDAMAVGGNSR